MSPHYNGTVQHLPDLGEVAWSWRGQMQEAVRRTEPGSCVVLLDGDRGACRQWAGDGEETRVDQDMAAADGLHL